MAFILTPEVADLIVFAMENQEDEFVFDTETAELVLVEEIPEGDEERYVPIPEWTPADGFRLMEQFVGTLQNPVYHEKLSEALSAGRGVFRRFKDTVKERPEIERQWHSFKDRAMREVVSEWYNDLRETWGLERLAFEQPETEDLVLSDFALRRIGEEDHQLIEEVRRLTREQYREIGAAGTAGAGVEAPRAGDPARGGDGEPDPTRGGSIGFAAEAPRGETAAVLWAAGSDNGGDGGDGGALGRGALGRGARGGRGALVVHTLYVAPAFRGLGLARLLLERLVETAREEGWDRVSLDLVSGGLVLDRTVEGLGFQTVAKRVALELE
ncbi:MAG: UPF0158 family protein [Spirochaetia bacterium]